jgi:hypothetical protein
VEAISSSETWHCLRIMRHCNSECRTVQWSSWPPLREPQILRYFCLF